MLLAAGCVVAGRDMPSGAHGPPEPPTYSVSGNAFSFAPPGFPGWGRIEGATVSVLEMPGFETTTVEHGYFEIDDLPVRSDITLVLRADGFPVTHTKTFRLTDADIDEVTFQVPHLDLFQLLAGVVGAEIDDDKCQIVSTATFLGGSLYLPNAHGEAGARVMLTPTDHDADGPIYFNESVIPDRSQELTSLDGGVVFRDDINVTTPQSCDLGIEAAI